MRSERMGGGKGGGLAGTGKMRPPGEELSLKGAKALIGDPEQLIASNQTLYVKMAYHLAEEARAGLSATPYNKTYLDLGNQLRLFVNPEQPLGLRPDEYLHRAIESIYARPLQEAAKEALNRELRARISDGELADLVLPLHEEDRLCVHDEDAEAQKPRIIRSLGIKEKGLHP